LHVNVAVQLSPTFDEVAWHRNGPPVTSTSWTTEPGYWNYMIAMAIFSPVKRHVLK
jgi:hypothetical protein